MDKVLLLLLASAILLLNYWFIRTAHRNLFGKQVVIAPLTVTGTHSGGDQLGGTLASVLQSRLVQIQHDLARAQGTLVKASSPVAGRDGLDDPRASYLPGLALPAVDIRSELFQPLNIDVAIKGVEVSDMLAWFQSRVKRPKTLQFNVLFDTGTATIAGDLGPLLGPEGGSVYLEVQSDKPLEIATQLAFALVQRGMSSTQSSAIDALDISEFQTLLNTLFEVAELERKRHLGRSGVAEQMGRYFEEIDLLARKVPEWFSLVYFAASLAESADQNARALHFYGELRRLSVERPAENFPISIEVIDEKIAALTGSTRPVEALEPRFEPFLSTVSAFREEMNLQGPHPEIVFPETNSGSPWLEGAQTFWDSEDGVYEVNPVYADGSESSQIAEELAKYVALMGPFMKKNYERCSSGGHSLDTEFWNDFRYTLANVITDGRVPKFWTNGRVVESFGRLLAGPAEVESVRQLAVALLDGFDCDWDYDNFLSKVISINAGLGEIPEEQVRKAFR